MKFNTVEEAIEYLHQEEIRDGIAKKIAEYNHLHWEKISESQKVSLRKESDLIVRYLHSQGVVIKVDRELPYLRTIPANAKYTKTITVTIPDWWDDVAMVSYLTRITQQDMLKWHNDSLEPLIHCSSCKKEPCTCPSIDRGSFAKYVEEG